MECTHLPALDPTALEHPDTQKGAGRTYNGPVFTPAAGPAGPPGRGSKLEGRGKSGEFYLATSSLVFRSYPGSRTIRGRTCAAQLSKSLDSCLSTGGQSPHRLAVAHILESISELRQDVFPGHLEHSGRHLELRRAATDRSRRVTRKSLFDAAWRYRWVGSERVYPWQK